MDICVMWTPDEKGWKRLSALHAVFAKTTGTSPGFYPHVSMGVYYSVPFDLMDEYAREFARSVRSFSVLFAGYRLVSPSVLVLEVANEGFIRDHHASFHSQLDEYADDWTRLDPYRYLPHSTVLNAQGQDLTLLAQAAQRDFRPFSARIDRLQLSRSFEEERYEILASYSLRG